MGNNQSKMDALNSQMNLLVESQAEEIETLKQMRVDDKIYNEEVLSKLMKENKELKENPPPAHPCQGWHNFSDSDIEDITDKNQKLNEENEELKKEKDKWGSRVSFYEDDVMNPLGDLMNPEMDYLWTHIGAEGIANKLVEFVENLKEENEELRSRTDALSKMNDKKHKHHKNKCEEVKKLKEAISELGTQNQYHKNGWEVFGCQSKKDLDDENEKLKEEIKEIQVAAKAMNIIIQAIEEEGEINAVKDEMITMYHIIMNDGDKYEISKDQPLLKMVQFNIGLMLEKFKEMGAIIQGTDKDKLCQGCGLVDKSMTGYCDKCIIQDYGDSSVQAKQRGIGSFAK